jgi:hypothetical protein
LGALRRQRQQGVSQHAPVIEREQEIRRLRRDAGDDVGRVGIFRRDGRDPVFQGRGGDGAEPLCFAGIVVVRHD